MPFGNKSRWSCAPFIESAAGYFEKPIAGSALEMVVVFLARYLIESSQFGCVNLSQPPLLNQKLQVAIYGSLVQRTYRPAAGFEKDLLDGISLICFPLHFRTAPSDDRKGFRQQS